MSAEFSMATQNSAPPVIIDGQALTIEALVAVARGERRLQLSDAAAFRRRIEKGAAFLASYLEQGGVIYGVTTGYGDNCTVTVPDELVRELPLHLTRYHGCGLGAILSEDATRAVLVARLQSLAQGFSGVRWELLERLCWLIQENILPLIPEEGSVGASGDLTPLSYVAAALVGERDVRWQGRVLPMREVYAQYQLAPLTLAPKEGLALMNGTAVMTGLACLAFDRARYLSALSARLTAMASLAMQGNREHFAAGLFAVKPHAGQQQIAAWIEADLSPGRAEQGPRLQDRYSVRCAPHVIGVLQDALSWLRRDIENELNSANDNPIVDADQETIWHGGHFYGGHIAFAMDALKAAVANLADLMDRQLALLVDTRYNHGLPQNLSGTQGPRAAINHGFKAVQISVSAWTAEALKLTLPASVFSRSTECHNQDKVSMGTIAARDALRVLTLTEQVAAAHLMAVTQGCELCARNGDLSLAEHAPAIAELEQRLRALSEFVDEDRPLEADLRRVLAAVQAQHFPVRSV